MAEQSDPLTRFTERARRVLALAQEEAARLNHAAIGSEHLLLGLLRAAGAPAAAALAAAGVELGVARRTVAALVARVEPARSATGGISEHAKRTIEAAVDEAGLLGHHVVGSEHLLLGLLRVREGTGYQVLSNLARDLDALRDEVVDSLLSADGTADSTWPSTTDRPEAGEPPGAAGGSPFDRFTRDARLAFVYAQEAAQRLGAAAIGPEHLLLGLTHARDHAAAGALAALGVSVDAVRQEVEAAIAAQRAGAGERGLTDPAKRAIERSVDEARRLGDDHIGTEHLLLGLAEGDEWIAAGVLARLGARPAALRAALGHLPARGVADPATPPRPRPAADPAFVPLAPAAPGPAGPGPVGRRTGRPRDLGQVRRVLGIGETAARDGVEVCLLALELYAAGFVVTLRLRLPFERFGRFGSAAGPIELPLEVHDDAGRAYVDETGGSGGGRRVGDHLEARLVFTFAPSPGPDVRTLTLAAPEVRVWKLVDADTGEDLGAGPQPRQIVPRVAATAPGPWRFTVRLPAGDHSATG